MQAQEFLPNWLAHPLAFAGDLEESVPASRAVDAVVAYLQYGALAMLADALDRNPTLDLNVEGAMRVAMVGQMDLEDWLAVFESLLETPRARVVLGLDTEDVFEEGDPVHAAAQVAGEDLPEISLSGLLHAFADQPDLDPQAARAAVVAVRALIARSRVMAQHALYYVQEVRPDEVLARRLVGTGHPPVRTHPKPIHAPFEADTLVFWDGSDRAIAVPRWLCWFDEPSRQLRLFVGRERTSGLYLYAAALRHVELVRVAEAPEGVPVFLAEPSWNTPAPAPSRDPLYAITRVKHENMATVGGSHDRIQTPPRRALGLEFSPPPAERAEARLVLRIIAGRELHRHAVLAPEQDILIGRNHAFANFVIHHKEISRSHTRVWQSVEGRVFVQDLKSTNATLLNGVPVGRDGSLMQLGDVVQVGPVLLRLEYLSARQYTKLSRITRLPEDRHRDPLTGLLKPRYLAEGLPASLRQGFREGKPIGVTLWGILVSVDKLAATHAQHGQAVADMVFRNVARCAMYAIDKPLRSVRVGYGELFVVLVDASQTTAEATGDVLLGCVQDHLWESPIQSVSLTASMARKHATESPEEWTMRARRTLQSGRSKAGRGNLYNAEESDEG